MIIITGGAGFIGSSLLWALNERGETNILLVDDIDHDEKEHNIAYLAYDRLMGIDEFREEVHQGAFDTQGVKALFHLGACSDTTKKNWNFLKDRNIAYSQDIIRWCTDRGVRCIYASSGAVYGDGSHGYSDDHALFDVLKPLNLYGKSKLDVDIWARDGGYLNTVVGLRYFNVFGPNEYHKEHMRSVIAKKFSEIQDKGRMTLFQSDNEQFKDGEQTRDFIYIKDALEATLFFLDHPEIVGVYNVGTGKEEPWNAVAKAMFTALKKEPVIEYIPMPKELHQQYQYRTKADMRKLDSVGFSHTAMPLHGAIREYIQEYLVPHQHLGES